MAANEDLQIRNFMIKQTESKYQVETNDVSDYADRFDFDFDATDVGF
ncbi:MAG: hypothetical protein AAGB15_02970 [Pseudomonadota bacterium]